MSGNTKSIAEVFEEGRDLFGRVPRFEDGKVCSACLGPVDGYLRCYSCHRLFSSGGAPSEIVNGIVPMTTAANPSSWYTRLVGYKGGRPDYQLPIVALVYTYIKTHAPRIEQLLGGPPDVITVVPSTRVAIEQQPLWRALHRVNPPDPRLGIVLRHRDGHSIGRLQFRPAAYEIEEVAARLKRVLLIEDLWVSGAKAVSAAGKLLDAGAQSVALLPIARELRPGGQFYRVDLPYFTACGGRYDIHDWPRP